MKSAATDWKPFIELIHHCHKRTIGTKDSNKCWYRLNLPISRKPVQHSMHSRSFFSRTRFTILKNVNLPAAINDAIPSKEHIHSQLSPNNVNANADFVRSTKVINQLTTK